MRENHKDTKDTKNFKIPLCVLCVFVVLSFVVSCSNKQEATLTVGAASDLAPAFEELGKLFEQTAGIKVVFSFGSTGLLTKQIEQGAPIDLFAAANVEYIDK